ncbi:hypothetical protein AX15_002238 [Amanita polypyramis BW_CC]|nr:hypothetical protein AX15_002238 [Amanita polypyramis BW_CC]
MVAYSSFFSSGLLASPVTIHSCKGNDEDMFDASPRVVHLFPAAPSSPMVTPDDSDIETEFDRATTPTPEPRSRTLSYENMMLSNSEFPSIRSGMGMTGVSSGQVSPRSPSQPPNGRRLRRRRSSLANASSPMNAIKSPLINAGQALELQRHLHKTPIKVRSSSVSLAAAVTDMLTGGGKGTASGEKSFIARLRSGSVSSFRRRPLRRAGMMPPAPPPTAPLPELPPSLADTPLCGFLPGPKFTIPVSNGVPSARNSFISPKIDNSAPTMYKKGRDRSYSVTMQQRIDEEMKEY